MPTIPLQGSVRDGRRVGPFWIEDGDGLDLVRRRRRRHGDRTLHPRRRPQRRVTRTAAGRSPRGRPAALAAPPHRRAHQVVPTTPPENPRPRRVRAGHVRARGASNGNGNGNGGGGTPAEDLDPGRLPPPGAAAISLLGRSRQAPLPAGAAAAHGLLSLALLCTIGAAGRRHRLHRLQRLPRADPRRDHGRLDGARGRHQRLRRQRHPHRHPPPLRLLPSPRPARPDLHLPAGGDRRRRGSPLLHRELAGPRPGSREAGWGYLRHANAGGASTIPEQLAKISFLQDNGSLCLQDQGDHPREPSWSTTSPRTRSWRCT